jgi:ribonuclease HI
MNINVYTDGGSRGNPGHSAFGLVVYDDQQQIIHKDSKYLGIKTNNEAEYAGLIAALEWIKKNQSKLNISNINFYSDSQLMVRQISGTYRVKASNLLPIFQEAKKLISQISLSINFQDVRRELNELADQLANEAMDRKNNS